MGANSTSLMGLSEIIQVRSLELSTERGVYVCLINVSRLHFKFFRHHFIGIALQLLFEEGIIGMAILQMEKQVQRGEALYLR